MRKRISSNPLTQHIQDNSSIYSFIVVLFLMGVIFGAVVVNSLSYGQKEDLFYYLSQFFGQVADGKVATSEDLFRQSFFHNVKFLGLIWILGISIIGLPLILILLFMKGVVVGFTVGFLVNKMGWGGFLLSVVTVLPQNLLIIPVFIFITVLSVGFSLKLIRKIFIKQGMNFVFAPLFMRYAAAFIIAIGIISVSASIEAYLSPALMKSIVSTLKS
ncbi:stage II sporulation protein M [Falsibacillus albus]|uniref:Stage II sporulation protein M n=1 Tax=Falsibacillus albus TaxID=2478915 RepID=A0A3L7JKI8_9BACI|nr:stage II sporulation protein M [Falsibacillus albus]RLQ90639.1 stage II sporulation protein M [Falsibacillus albus]